MAFNTALKNKLNCVYGQVQLKKNDDEWARNAMMENWKQSFGIVTHTKNEIVSSLHMILGREKRLLPYIWLLRIFILSVGHKQT